MLGLSVLVLLHQRLNAHPHFPKGEVRMLSKELVCAHVEHHLSHVFWHLKLHACRVCVFCVFLLVLYVRVRCEMPGCVPIVCAFVRVCGHVCMARTSGYAISSVEQKSPAQAMRISTAHAAVLLCCYTAMLLYCYTAMLLYCYTAILLYCHAATLLYCYTAILLQRGTCKMEDGFLTPIRVPKVQHTLKQMSYHYSHSHPHLPPSFLRARGLLMITGG